ncbi:helix-turn-helix domain-containing protein [Cohnella panacarvi]|uniref:helix-turn-helix domain-containing protein n=1 Tax=Cohnella panacarvi TaxID=400776 RepID=UPI000558ECD1|nr:helix-turn-helix transcriptional regulator [Cohnella panacarvi]
MERMGEILAELIDKRGSRRAFAEEIGMPPTTLQSMLTRGLARASVVNVVKVCQALGITVEQLGDMANEDDRREPDTIAAHHDGDVWTDEELAEIERFKHFVRMKRNEQGSD